MKRITLFLVVNIVCILMISACAKYENPADIPYGSSDWQTDNKPQIVENLKKAGFNNIIEESKETTDIDKVDKVYQLTVDNNNLFSKGRRYEANVPIEVKYFALKSFTPTMDIETIGEEGKPEFVIKTNLPYRTKIHVSLDKDNSYHSEQEVEVDNGEAKTSAFHDLDTYYMPLAEDYVLTVRIDTLDQGATFRAELGKNGECLSGDDIQYDDNGLPYIEITENYHSPYSMGELNELKSQKSIDEIIFDLKFTLNQSDGIKYEIEDIQGTLTVKTWYDGAAAFAALAASGDSKSLEKWNSVTETLNEFSQSVRKLLVANGHQAKDYAVTLQNDINQDNSLYVIKNGSVVYDCVTMG